MSPEPVNEMEPKIISLPVPQPKISPGSGSRAFYGLLWCEWYAHSKLLLGVIGVWLAAIWILPLYVNPAWILLFGALFAIIAGPVYGGSDTSEGCEEFTFALPPTRAERYLARLMVGGGALLLLTAIDLMVLGLDLSQVLAKLYVDTGLIHPKPIFKSGLLYSLVLVLPWTAFAFSFVISAITHSRAVLVSAALWAILFSLTALRLGFWYEELVWGKLNGLFSCPLLLFLSVAVLWGGYRVYQRKEIGYHTVPISIPASWWFWIVLFLVGLIATMSLTASLAKHYLRILTGS